jgi:NAD(P)-dependent dehydrogenase (short-subunit alcohol dehydrogenase family)
MAGLLAGQRCLIVGGTSGIGLAAALRFHEEGARVVAVGLPGDGGTDRPPAPPSADQPGVAVGDATDPVSVDGFVAEAVRSLGGLDVLYHVAGGSGRKHGDGPLHECSSYGWDWTVRANLTGVFLTNRAAVRHFLGARQPGVILNVASVLAFSPSPRHFDTVAYAAAKAGVIALSRQAAARYAADGVRVNVLAPGLIDTPMAARAVRDPAVAAFLRTKQPLAGGPGTPLDCSYAAAFLCSDEARFITGSVLTADGGWCLSDGQFA